MESELFRSLGLFVNKRQLATEKCAGRRKQLTKKYVWRVAILVMHPFSHHRIKIYFILKQMMCYCLTTGSEITRNRRYALPYRPHCYLLTLQLFPCSFVSSPLPLPVL